MKPPRWPYVALFFIALWLVALFYLPLARGRDLGQWENNDPAISQWYRGLMQPDHPTIPCCGEADAYWADQVHIRDGKTFAVVTDDRDDEPLHRPHIEVGTEVEIPNAKLKYDAGNPTGHGVLFVSTGGGVYCFVQAGGV